MIDTVSGSRVFANSSAKRLLSRIFGRLITLGAWRHAAGRQTHRGGVMKFRFWGLAAFVSFLLSMPFVVRAEEPMAQLSASINQFVAIMSNTSVAELRATGLPEKARQLVFARFDFSEMTKRSLGAHWKSMDQREQREFIAAFTQRLLVFYGKSVRSTGNEKIEFMREVREGKQASVETKVISGNGDETPIDYRLRDVDGQWMVYDVVIDNVSLVNNYRSQFERVIAKSSVQDLLRKMKNQDS
jgi:phospholipid transport system substrate-binding protein